MVRFATIGTSWITDSFIQGSKIAAGDLSLEAVYSRDKNKGVAFANKYGCNKVYTSLEELGKNSLIDAVYIASPNALHYSQSKLMLKFGKHVICEKPITVTPKELTQLQRLASSKGLVYMEALMARHLPSRNILFDAVKKLGRISHVRFDFSQRSSKYDSFMAGNHQNIFDPKMATGALMDLGIYCVYPCIDFFGMPNSINAHCTKLGTGIDGAGGATLSYDGFFAELIYSKTGQSMLGSEIVGENGTIVIPSISKLTNMKLIYTDGTEEALTKDTTKAELMSYEANDFYNYITQPDNYKDELLSSNRLALDVSKVMYKIRSLAGIKFTK